MTDSLAPELPVSLLLPALGNSFLLMLSTCAGCLVLGGLAALALFQAGWHRSGWIKAILFFPLVWPPFLYSIGWMIALGERGLTLFQRDAFEGGALALLFSLGGAAFIQTLAFWPIVALIGVWGFSRVDRHLLELALLEGGSRVRLAFLLVRLNAIPLLLGTFLIAVLSLEDIGTPEMLQVDTFPVVLYTELNVVRELLPVLPLLAPLAAVALGASLLWVFGRRLAVSLRDSSPLERPAFEGGWKRPLLTLAMIALPILLGPGVGAGSQIAAVIQDRFTLHWSLLAECLWASVWAGLGTVFLMALALSAVSLPRWTGKRAVVFETLAFLLFALPAPFLALALLKVFTGLGSTGGLVLDSFWILCLCGMIRFFWIAWSLIRIGESQVDPEIWESARLEGCGGGLSFLFQLHLPMLSGVWCFALAVTWVLAIGEITFSRVLQPPGFQTLAARTVNFMHWGHDSMVAMGLLLIACLQISPFLLAAVGRGLLRVTDRES
jgi:ABC-type Fe3+ transport system permease subunit